MHISLTRKLNLKINALNEQFNQVSDLISSIGWVIINITVQAITAPIQVFILDKKIENDELIAGQDFIHQFNLRQDPDLKIYQIIGTKITEIETNLSWYRKQGLSFIEIIAVIKSNKNNQINQTNYLNHSDHSNYSNHSNHSNQTNKTNQNKSFNYQDHIQNHNQNHNHNHYQDHSFIKQNIHNQNNSNSFTHQTLGVDINQTECLKILCNFIKDTKDEFNINNSLNLYHINQIKNIISKVNVFSRNKYDIGRIDSEYCRIPLIHDNPICQRPYRCGLTDQIKIKQITSELLEKGIIRRSYSPYSAPVTLVGKKDEGEKTRLCIDLRQLNKITIPDNYPFPRIEDIIDKLYNSKYFTTLDITSGFWIVPVHPDDIHKTAFATMDDHFEFLVMPFGFRNAPAIFQRVIYTILRKNNLDRFSHNYIDDILIYSKSLDEHLNHIQLVLNALERQKIKLKLSKCHFAKEEITYLGHSLSYNKIKPKNSNIQAITDFPIPEKVKNVEQFLGKVNYYRKFIPNITAKLSPLYELLTNEQRTKKFIWNEQCHKSFIEIKTILTSHPVLAIYNPEEKCHLFTDASKIGIGAVLKQKQEDQELHPIGYFSRKLLSYQKNYSASEIELLAIKEATEYWNHYLFGSKFTCYTDHQALKYLHSMKNLSSRIAKWAIALDMYQFDIIYKPGKDNVEADCLSRNPIESNSEELINSINSINVIRKKYDFNLIIKTITKEKIIEHQQIILNKIEEKLNHINTNKDKIRQKLRKEYGLNKTTVINNIIFKLKDDRKKIFIPESLTHDLIEAFHTEYGHIGIKQMTMLITRNYYFQKSNEIIKEYCDSCYTCIQNKSRLQKALGQLSQLGPATQPLYIIAMDTVGGFSNPKSKQNYLHIAIDAFTRYVWIITSRTQTAKDFISLMNQVKQEGRISYLLCDLYSGINSTDFKKYLRSNKIKSIFTTPDAAQSLGLCERVNQTLVNKIRCQFNEEKQKRSWSAIAHQVVQQYNATPHTVTSYSPSFLLKGIWNNTAIIENEHETLEQARQSAFEKSQKYHNVNKDYYDERRKNAEFNIGDLVFIKNKNKISRKKLESLFKGPFKINKKVSSVIYEVKTDKQKIKRVHVTNIRTASAIKYNSWSIR
jgi:putative transposase